ncbi:MAG: amino acid--tRNA ligase-related protein [Polyangiaceae bacterium]
MVDDATHLTICSPLDLSRMTAGQRLRVGGRILVVQDESCILADALAQIRANCSGATPALGSFAVLDGIWDGQALQHAEVELERAAPPPSGDGDFARLSLAGVGHNLAARARALSALRAYFAEQDFLEIDAPFIVQAPGLDAYVEAVKADGGYCSTSPEFQLKRLLAAGLPRPYCLGHVARAEEDGPWHEREFCMLEWYRALPARRKCNATPKSCCGGWRERLATVRTWTFQTGAEWISNRPSSE